LEGSIPSLLRALGDRREADNDRVGSTLEFSVVPLPTGGWAVKRCAGEQPLSVHTCQALAQVEALKLALPMGGRVVVHQRDQAA
jgi:Uncharacterized protein conserved in bacteria (DUF2188)